MLEVKLSSTIGLSKKIKEGLLKEVEINNDLREEIDKFTEHLIMSNYPYDTLCWALAEFELIFEKGHKKYSEHEVIEREKQIFDASLDYDELCWFIARHKVNLERINNYP